MRTVSSRRHLGVGATASLATQASSHDSSMLLLLLLLLLKADEPLFVVDNLTSVSAHLHSPVLVACLYQGTEAGNNLMDE